MSLCCAAAIAHPLDTLTLHEHCELHNSGVRQNPRASKLKVHEHGKAQLALNNIAMKAAHDDTWGMPACRVRLHTANCAPVSAQVYGQIAVEQHQVLSHKEAWGTELYQLK